MLDEILDLFHRRQSGTEASRLDSLRGIFDMLGDGADEGEDGRRRDPHDDDRRGDRNRGRADRHRHDDIWD